MRVRQQRLVQAGILGISAVLAAFLLASALLAGNETKPRPEVLRADALINMARYVEWPDGVFFQTNAPVMLGVYGKSPLIEELKRQAKDKRVDGRQIIVREFSWPQAPNCHVLYVAETEKPRLLHILGKLRHATVLTVSETEQFALQGGMIQFVLNNDKVHFSVNLAAATNARLKLSARLLSVAEKVQ